MKKQIKPFKIEVKGRARKRGAPAGLWGDLLTQGDDAALLQPDTASIRTDAASAPAVSPTANKRGRGPRILDAVAPAPAPAQVSEIEERDDIGTDRSDIDEVSLEDTDDADVLTDDADMDLEALSAQDGGSTSEPEPSVGKPRRLPRRNGEFRAGERWKRHLPRWKR